MRDMIDRVAMVIVVTMGCLLSWTTQPLAKAPAPPQAINGGRLYQPRAVEKSDADGYAPIYLSGTTSPLPSLYLIIDVTPVDGNSYSRGYGINNAAKIVGRTYNTDESDTVQDQRALSWDMDLGSQALDTLAGASGAWGINDAGMACGYATNADGDKRAARWNLEDGSLIDLGTLTNPNSGQSGTESYSYSGINDSQTVVGHADIPNDDGSFTSFHAFIYDDTNGIRDLGTLYGDTDPAYMGGYSIAYDINNSDTVVGIAHDANWAFLPFVWSEANGMTALIIDTSRGSGEWYGAVINDDGLIGGHVIDGGNDTVDFCYPYYWPTENGDPIALDMPETYPYGEIYGINANGQMVGGMFNDEDQDHAFVFDRTNGVIDLNACIDASEDWELQTAVDINDSGQITGIGLIGGDKHAFLLTPATDTNTDADIDGGDLSQLAQDIESTCNENCAADFNDDTVVDSTDLYLLSLVFGHAG